MVTRGDLKDRLVKATQSLREPRTEDRDVLWDAFLDHVGLEVIEKVADELEMKSTLSTPCIADLFLESSMIDVNQPRDNLSKPFFMPHDKREWIEWLANVIENGGCCDKEVALMMKGDCEGTYELTLEMLTHAIQMSTTKIGQDYRNFVASRFAYVTCVTYAKIARGGRYWAARWPTSGYSDKHHTRIPSEKHG